MLIQISGKLTRLNEKFTHLGIQRLSSRVYKNVTYTQQIHRDLLVIMYIK